MKIIEYREEFGEVEFPEGFEEELRGKSLGEQMGCFRIASSASLTKTYYGEEGARGSLRSREPSMTMGISSALSSKAARSWAC